LISTITFSSLALAVLSPDTITLSLLRLTPPTTAPSIYASAFAKISYRFSAGAVSASKENPLRVQA